MEPIYQNKAIAYGVSQSTYDSLSPELRSLLDLTANSLQTNIALGRRIQNITPDTVIKAYKDSLNDPTINDYYKQQLQLGQRDLQMSLDFVNAQDTIEREQAQRNYEQAQMNQQEQAASAGQAYSSYRNRAAQDLRLQQTGVTDLRKLNNKKNAFTLGSQFEKNYGSANTPNVNVGGQQYTPFGNVVGTNANNMAQSQLGRAQENILQASQLGQYGGAALPSSSTPTDILNASAPIKQPTQNSVGAGQVGVTQQWLDSHPNTLKANPGKYVLK